MIPINVDIVHKQLTVNGTAYTFGCLRLFDDPVNKTALVDPAKIIQVLKRRYKGVALAITFY